MLKLFSTIPLARLLIPFLAGIIAAAFAVERIQVEPKLIVALFIALGITFLGLRGSDKTEFQNRWIFGLVTNVAFFACGVLVTLVNSNQLFPVSLANQSGEKSDWLLILEETPVEKNRSFKLEGTTISANEQGFGGRTIVYVAKSEKAKNLIVGDRILFSAALNEITTPGNPNEFNYPRYLRFNGILRQAYIPNEHWVMLEPTTGFHPVRWLRNLRATLLKQLDEARFKPQERAVIAALTLGYKQELDSETTSSFAVAGAMHVLAVSGLHVGILYMLINTLLGFLNRMKHGKVIKLILTVFILFGYAGLTGMSASVFRAATMFSFVAWGKSTKRSTNIYNTLAASAMVLLLFDPYLIMQVGFQLSYCAVIGIVIIHPLLFNLIVVKNRVMDWAWNITCVSVAAQIATFPLGLLYFHQFPNYFLFSNLIVIPLATFIMYAGLLFFSVSWIPYVSTAVAFVLSWLTAALNYCVSVIELLPYAITSEIDISVLETLLIYTLIGSIIYLLHLRSFRSLYVTFASVAIIISLQILEGNQQKEQHLSVMYNVRNGFALDMIEGTDHMFIANNELLTNESGMLFHVKHHWWYRGLQKRTTQTLDSLSSSKSLFNVSGNNIWIIPKNVDSIPSLRPDIAVVSSISDLSFLNKSEEFSCDLILLASDLKKWQLNKWKKALAENEIAFYAVSEQGPYYFQQKRSLIAEGP